MAKTIKGNETKEKILNSAKKSFYRFGFIQNTLADICKRSKVQLGTLTYYYPKKTDIVLDIYQQYNNKISAYLKKHTQDLDILSYYFHYIFIYYYMIYSDEKTRLFHYETMHENTINTIFRSLNKTGEPLYVDLSDEDKALFIYADNAVRREMNIDFYKKGEFSFESVKELIYKIHKVNCKFYDIPLEEMKKRLDAAAIFLEEHLNCNIQLLA